jgi:FkbM family methyltransferase
VIGARLRFYGKEIRLALRMGASVSSRLHLVANTLRFHLRNMVRSVPPAADPGAARYRIRIAGRCVDLYLRTTSGDLFIYHEIFATQCYAVPPTLLPDAQIIVDLGANVGLATLFYADRFKGARFVCVEPDPRNVPLLRKNVAWLGERVLVIDGAVRSLPGMGSFDDTSWSWGGQLQPEGRGGRPVRCFTLDEIMALARLDRIDLLKVDIENGVEDLFRANNRWLDRVRLIVVELTARYPFDQFARDVSPYGFRVLHENSPEGNQMIMAVRGGVRAP